MVTREIWLLVRRRYPRLPRPTQFSVYNLKRLVYLLEKFNSWHMLLKIIWNKHLSMTEPACSPSVG